MIKMLLSNVIGFILLVVESFIVMKLKGLQNIDFNEMTPFINAWAVNFFFVYTILTHIEMWHTNNKNVIDE